MAKHNRSTFLIIWLVCSMGLVNGVRAAEVELNGHQFTLPDGFEIQQVAGPPLVNRPINADLDEQGRLYVTDSSGSNENVKLQLEKKPHRIVRLEDTDGDGRYDSSTVFADRMSFPEGAMWYNGSLYVCAPPQIWKLTDTNDDGTADQREVWFDAKTLTNCANDLHGPYLGPDGWIYWCKGAFAEQTYERPGKQPFVTRAAHIFRRRPEGGPVEPVMTGGMDNPVEVAFTPGGERIFTTTFFQHPAGGFRDGLIHAIYGGVYGKVHGVLDGHPRTGPIMPVLVHLGAAAPSGLTRLESARFGDGFQDNLLASSFNMHKITRHVLQPRGATFDVHTEDFLVSDNLDFHPTDVLEDHDGSVLAVDTGGWYKLCCPTSQLWKPDILGAIYRVRRVGADRIVDPRGRRITWSSLSVDELTDLLKDSRFAVRKRARQQLRGRGADAIAALQKVIAASQILEQRREAVWAATLIDHPQARAAVREALHDSDEVVRQAALHSTSVWRDALAEEAVTDLLRSDSAHNRRAAAEALGRLGSSQSVFPLLSATVDCQDRILEHSLIYAVIQLADPEITRTALKANDVRVQKAALIALDQMPQGNLRVADVRPLLDSKQKLLNETAWWIAEQHPEWADNLADYFHDAVMANRVDADDLAQLSARLAQFAQAPEIQQIMGRRLAHSAVQRETQLAILQAMADSRLKVVPDSWSHALLQMLDSADVELLSAAVRAIDAVSQSSMTPQMADRLQAIAENPDLPPDVRLPALRVVPKADRRLEPATLHFLCDQLEADRPVQLRSQAVDVLLDSPLDDSQLFTVTQAIPNVGSLEIRRLMELFAKSHNPEFGLRMVVALEICPSAAALSADELEQQLAKFGAAVLKKAEGLLGRIRQENRDKIQQLESVLELVDNGDIRRGQRIFHNNKTACVTCHAMGYLGGRVGPDLTRIGRIRSERDLLESILFPSASFVRSYESAILVTVDGRVFSGVVRDETSRELVLQVDAQKVVRLPVNDIDQRQPGTVSIMPAGLEKQLTPQELADLVKFLKVAQ